MIEKKDNQTGLAVYSLPEQTVFYEIRGTLAEVEVSEVGKQAGFVFAPFDTSEKRVVQILGEVHQSDLSWQRNELNLGNEMPYQMPWEEYEHAIQKVIQNINETDLQKLVFSISRVNGPVEDCGHLLKKLRAEYPNAFVYLFSSPTTGTWIGASPELLLRRENQLYTTVALAGTLRNAPNLSDWGEKEIAEHRFVEEYVEDALKTWSFDKQGPNPRQAGPIYHLSSTYTVSDSVELYPSALHPGPALSGTPVPLSVELIPNIEMRPRKYYAGYLGPVTSDAEYQMYINLRCMEVLENKTVLYAGGGITKDSKPDKEWQELQYKFSTLQAKMTINQ